MRRAELLREMRSFFDARDYWEVETPLLSRETCVDQWIEPFRVPLHDGTTCYLQTSPEFAMKRLLASGAEAIWQLTKSFRTGEQGTRHNPEFTIAEWYRVGDNHFAQMKFTEEFVRHVLNFAREQGWHSLKLPTEPFLRVTYDEAFEQALGTRVLALTDVELKALARKSLTDAGGDLNAMSRDTILNLLLAECVEPMLAEMGPIFLIDYPASQAALAKVRPDTPDVAERFELYINGIELCNGYHELTNADELRERMKQQNQLRIESKLEPLPVQSHLLDAMEHGLPACSGVALGVDRLIMLALDQSQMDHVIAFPFDRA